MRYCYRSRCHCCLRRCCLLSSGWYCRPRVSYCIPCNRCRPYSPPRRWLPPRCRVPRCRPCGCSYPCLRKAGSRQRRQPGIGRSLFRPSSYSFRYDCCLLNRCGYVFRRRWKSIHPKHGYAPKPGQVHSRIPYRSGQSPQLPLRRECVQQNQASRYNSLSGRHANVRLHPCSRCLPDRGCLTRRMADDRYRILPCSGSRLFHRSSCSFRYDCCLLSRCGYVFRHRWKSNRPKHGYAPKPGQVHSRIPYRSGQSPQLPLRRECVQ